MCVCVRLCDFDLHICHLSVGRHASAITWVITESHIKKRSKMRSGSPGWQIMLLLGCQSHLSSMAYGKLVPAAERSSLV